MQVIETKKRVYRKEHHSTLNSMGNLALVYNNQGRLKEAEELGMQVIETIKRVLGKEYLKILIGINNLAWIYSSQRR